MVSYLDEKAMNVAQELSDRELYDYDALVGLLSARFDPASRVSASRSRFHGRTRRHQEDADTYADSITELCRQTPGSRQSPNKDHRAPFRPRNYSRTKCFSCGQLGHTQVRCPKPDSSLPFRPSGWVDRSDGPQRNSGAPPQGNEI